MRQSGALVSGNHSKWRLRLNKAGCIMANTPGFTGSVLRKRSSMIAAYGVLALALFVGPAQSQTLIEEIRLRVLEPSGGAVRPLEQAVVQVQVYGRIVSKEGRETRGLLPVDGAFMAFEEKNSGWLSKAYQCPDFRQADYARERSGGWKDVLAGVQDFALKNCFLYTAPPKTGKYLLQASINGMAGDIRLDVSNSAPSTRQPESINFPPEAPSKDPYFPLVEHYAPFIAQETWFNPAADEIARFDYDGDFDGSNNWDNLGQGSSQAYVYYAVMETETHWFLHYNFFHPRDYSDVCMAGTCHENDNEGLILAVRKDGTPFGKPEAMQTLAHDILFSYTADERIADGAHEIRGPLILHDGSHPMVFIEAAGHGVLGVNDQTYSLFEYQVMEFLPGSTGITYRYKGGVAERPGHAGATEVGYALLPIYEHWWLRSDPSHNERTFSDYYTYQPLGGRPLPTTSQLAGAFLGIKQAANKAKPFWGWHDDRTLRAGILSRGQWGLDPAYGFSVNLRFPSELPVSLNYRFNPYLGVAAPQGMQAATTTAVRGTFQVAPNGSTAGTTASTPGTATQSGQPATSSTKPSLSGWGDAPSGANQTGTPPSGSTQSGTPQTSAPQGWGDPVSPGQTTGPAQDGPAGWGPTPPNLKQDGANHETKPDSSGPQGWGPPAA